MFVFNIVIHWGVILKTNINVPQRFRPDIVGSGLDIISYVLLVACFWYFPNTDIENEHRPSALLVRLLKLRSLFFTWNIMFPDKSFSLRSKTAWKYHVLQCIVLFFFHACGFRSFFAKYLPSLSTRFTLVLLFAFFTYAFARCFLSMPYSTIWETLPTRLHLYTSSKRESALLFCYHVHTWIYLLPYLVLFLLLQRALHSFVNPCFPGCSFSASPEFVCLPYFQKARFLSPSFSRLCVHVYVDTKTTIFYVFFSFLRTRLRLLIPVTSRWLKSPKWQFSCQKKKKIALPKSYIPLFRFMRISPNRTHLTGSDNGEQWHGCCQRPMAEPPRGACLQGQ